MKLIYSNPNPLRTYPTARLLQIVERPQFVRTAERLREAVHQELSMRIQPLKRAA